MVHTAVIINHLFFVSGTDERFAHRYLSRRVVHTAVDIKHEVVPGINYTALTGQL